MTVKSNLHNINDKQVKGKFFFFFYILIKLKTAYFVTILSGPPKGDMTEKA